MKWIEVNIKTTTEAVEAVSNILYEVGVGGVVIEDSNDLIIEENDIGDWDYIDESLLEDKFDGAIVKGYLPEGEDLLDKIELIKANVEKIPQYNLDKGLGEVTTSEVYEEDWENAWKKYYKPKKIGDRIVIKPTWEDYEALPGDIVIELDPGMAFGTGTHETTIMCIQELEKYINKDSIVFDIGCGSGILSIASAKLGAYKVVGIDLDEVATTVSTRNVIINKVEDKVEIRKGNLMEVIHEKADIIVSNIIADVIMILASQIKDYLKEKGIFIASGIILEKVDEVLKNLNDNGLKILETRKMGDWVVIVSTPKDEKTNA
jgi:ribosomal protein L11 methyltransferase